jgi:Tfp pilus assembly protein PilN
MERQRHFRGGAVVVAPAGLRKWLAFGTGVGIEIGAGHLSVSVVRVRPAGKNLLGFRKIEGYRERPASDWGAEYAAFLRGLRAHNLPATVLLPRKDVIVRLISLAGVDDRDLASAISYQIDSLHPYTEEEAAYTSARLPGTPDVLVGITRREVVDEYSNLFAEAGIKVASFTFSAPALYSAIRIHNFPPRGFLTLMGHNGTWEAYGESPARRLFTGVFEQPAGVVVPVVLSELRLEPDGTPIPVDGLLGLGVDSDTVGAALAAVGSACPRLTLQANLLPAGRRAQLSRFRYAPTAALAAMLLAALALFSAQPSYQNARYLRQLEAEIAQLEKQAAKVREIDSRIEHLRQKQALLERFASRSKADADALLELTHLMKPPAWLQSVQINREEVQFSGEAEQAAPMLKIIDDSPLFHQSAFAQPMGRTPGGMESFIIRAAREGPGAGKEDSQ